MLNAAAKVTTVDSNERGDWSVELHDVFCRGHVGRVGFPSVLKSLLNFPSRSTVRDIWQLCAALVIPQSHCCVCVSLGNATFQRVVPQQLLRNLLSGRETADSLFHVRRKRYFAMQFNLYVESSACCAIRWFRCLLLTGTV
jgi:hypothetical protein